MHEHSDEKREAFDAEETRTGRSSQPDVDIFETETAIIIRADMHKLPERIVGSDGNFAAQTIDFARQGCDRRLLEQDAQTNIHAKCVAQPGQQTRRRQRVAAVSKKIIIATDAFDTEHSAPNFRDSLLRLALGRGPGRRGEGERPWWLQPQ